MYHILPLTVNTPRWITINRLLSPRNDALLFPLTGTIPHSVTIYTLFSTPHDVTLFITYSYQTTIYHYLTHTAINPRYVNI